MSSPTKDNGFNSLLRSEQKNKGQPFGIGRSLGGSVPLRYDKASNECAHTQQQTIVTGPICWPSFSVELIVNDDFSFLDFPRQGRAGQFWQLQMGKLQASFSDRRRGEG